MGEASAPGIAPVRLPSSLAASLARSQYKSYLVKNFFQLIAAGEEEN